MFVFEVYPNTTKTFTLHMVPDIFDEFGNAMRMKTRDAINKLRRLTQDDGVYFNLLQDPNKE